MATIIWLILYLKYLKEIHFHEWRPTRYNSWSLKQQTRKRNICILGCKATESHWEKHMVMKNRFLFFPVPKYYLKSVSSRKNKTNTAARKIEVQLAGTPKSLIEPTPFRIPTLWEGTSFETKRGHKETISAFGFPWIPLKGQNSPTELLQNLPPFLC